MPSISFKSFWCFAGLLVFTGSLAPRDLWAEMSVDWDSMRASYALYSKVASEENALKAASTLPNNLGYLPPASARRNHLETEKFILKHLGPLESQIFRGKVNSTALAFRFYTIADGELADNLDILLGRLICRNPRLFLRELKANRRLVSRLDALLMNYGPDYADKDEAQTSEFNRRLKCLRKVRDPELQEIRDECVEFMEMNPQ